MFAEGDNMFRIGQSIDIHQLVEGRDLYIGGVKIDHDKGLLGHSDADVLLHAIIESIIGALGLGDIGKHFPDTDPQYKGISSMVLLSQVNYIVTLAKLTLKQHVEKNLVLSADKKEW